MARLIDADALPVSKEYLVDEAGFGASFYVVHKSDIDNAPTVDAVEVVRCKDCVHATELDNHCELSRNLYRHCNMYRGDDTRHVWHKYKRYFKDYSLVAVDGFCDCGERKDTDNE